MNQETRVEEEVVPSLQTPQVEHTTPPATERETVRGHSVGLDDVHAFYGETHAVRGVSLNFEANRVTAMIGPSGCGKSTLVRCINRMHEEIPGARAKGKITLDDLDLYDDSIDVVSVRRSVGMVFQKPNPFPTMSIFDNVAAGLRLTGRRGDIRERVEKSLRGAGLWDEVKDRLGGRASGSPAASSSGSASRARSRSSPR